RRVAGLYGNSVVLVGEDATRENVTAAIGRAPILHLATHAVAVPNEPAKSYLALASSATGSGFLSLGDITRSSLISTSVVMLSGCRTAVAAHGAPISSLALAFLAAGAPNVVGALWTVDDEGSTAMLTTEFHRALRAGAPPAAALREAQLALIRSPDPRFRSPSAWSGFQLFAVRREGGGKP
ncbi:MAG TPA: CHAT domain-containing protein, partial [Candidatus Polarisedimenticolia bacterium]|nr:CHAT domain-containing protein [Candidatus Polarisedimenticolia bacterium]